MSIPMKNKIPSYRFSTVISPSSRPNKWKLLNLLTNLERFLTFILASQKEREVMKDEMTHHGIVIRTTDFVILCHERKLGISCRHYSRSYGWQTKYQWTWQSVRFDCGFELFNDNYIITQAKLLAKVLPIKYIVVFKSVCHQGGNEEP